MKKEIVLKFIENVSKTAEVELFWRLFHEVPRLKFALVTINYEVLKNHLEPLAENIALMNQLDLYPILILKLQPANTPITITQPQLKRKFTQLSQKLCQEVRRKKGHIQIAQNLFTSPLNTKQKFTFNVDRLNTILKRGKTPIISPLFLKDGKSELLDAEYLTHYLVQRFKPKKHILLTSQGGILDTQNNVLPFLNMFPDKDWKQTVHPEMKKQTTEIRNFIKNIPNTAVVVTSAEDMLKEIFTIKGHGTFIKHHQLEFTHKLSPTHKKKIKLLLENAFNKMLVPHYFSQAFKSIIYQKDFEGVAIIQEILGVPYLDKFAVAKLYEGTGLGKSLWQKTIQKFPTLVWRATPNNPLNSFYCRECDGCIKFENWHIYWTGIPHEKIMPLIEAVRNKPATLMEQAH